MSYAFRRFWHAILLETFSFGLKQSIVIIIPSQAHAKIALFWAKFLVNTVQVVRAERVLEPFQVTATTRNYLKSAKTLE